MKRIIMILLALAIATTLFGCKPKPANDNIMFAAKISAIEEDGWLVETAADVGFTTALIHIGETCKPDFTPAPGQTVELTILPMVTRSIPPQATAVEARLLAPAPDNAASVTDGFDPMPMLTPGADAGVEAPDTLAARMADMLPVFDAITRTMGIEGEQGYLPADASFVWSVLANLMNDWGQTEPSASLAEDTVIVPLAAVQGWAMAAFGRDDALPPIPETLASRLTYDEAHGAYRLVREDMENASVTQIETFADHGDGTYDALLGFYTSTVERLGGMLFTMRDAQGAGGRLKFSVTAAEAERG